MAGERGHGHEGVSLGQTLSGHHCTAQQVGTAVCVLDSERYNHFMTMYVHTSSESVSSGYLK